VLLFPGGIATLPFHAVEIVTGILNSFTGMIVFSRGDADPTVKVILILDDRA
jgi:hypothetical protein